MTDKELRIELAKAALNGCGGVCKKDVVDAVVDLYEWIKESTEDQAENLDDDGIEFVEYDAYSIRDLIEHLSTQKDNKNVVTLIKHACADCFVKTIGDLMRLGCEKFKKSRFIGRKSIWKINDALEEMYGINGWINT